MKNAITFLAFCFAISVATAQNPTFSEDIANIIYTNCTSCHRSGGIAPFPLTSYDAVVLKSSLIPFYIEAGIMPPWPPDTSYQHYAGERLLSQQEITDIVTWIGNGTPEGDTALAPDPPVFIEGSEIGIPDLKLQMPAYTSKATGFDEYVCFSIPINISTTKYIRAIEVIPGNRGIVHHALAYLDETGTIQTDTSGCLGLNGASLMTGFTPGAGPTIFPSTGSMNMGMTVSPGSNLVLQIHYPNGSGGQTDSTYVNLFFYPDSVTNVREVSASAILSNWALAIPANTITSFDAQYPPGAGTLPASFSLLTVFPHMHLVGKSIEAYAVTATNDTLPFVRINNWDFEWQGFYNFKKVKVLNAGTKLYGKATYDNTTANLNNPNNPPQLVLAGESTTDEMFLVYFHYLLYQPGDELLNLDSLLSIPLNTNSTSTLVNSGSITLRSYPNPFDNSTTLEYYLPSRSNVSLSIIDILGRTVRYSAWDEIKGMQSYHWDGTDTDGHQVKNGIYYFLLKANDEVSSLKALVMRTN